MNEAENTDKEPWSKESIRIWNTNEVESGMDYVAWAPIISLAVMIKADILMNAQINASAKIRQTVS
jgi:hypothetical protein